jgi:hypothetical protein
MTDRLNPIFYALTKENRLKQLLVLWISAFFFHTVADPATTYVAVTHLGVGVETNPFIRVWLDKGVGNFILIHIPLYALGVVGFVFLRWLIKQGSEHEQRQVYYLSVIVLCGINIWGVVLVFNNLWVIWIMS